MSRSQRGRRPIEGPRAGSTGMGGQLHAGPAPQDSDSSGDGESRYRAAAPGQKGSKDRRFGITAADLRSLPTAFPFDPIVPMAFGISRSAAYRALAAGELPIQPLRLGRRLIVKRAELLAALGVEDIPDGGVPSATQGLGRADDHGSEET